MESTLAGYVRASKSGKCLKVSLDAKAFKKLKTYETKDGTKFVQLVINSDKVGELLSGDREVTSISQLND